MPNVDNNLCRVVALFRERFFDFRSCSSIVLNHFTRGRPGVLLQSSGEEAVRILLAVASSGICAVCPSRERHRDWTI